MPGILEFAAFKLLADKIKEKASSEVIDGAWKPLGQLLDSSQEKLLGLWGHIDPEFADILGRAVARAYVQAIREITENYLKKEEHKILKPESEINAQREIKVRLKALLKKPEREIAPVMGTSSITPAAGFDDDEALTRELLKKAEQDLGTVPEALRSSLEKQLLRNLRHELWIELSKSLKNGKSSSLMSAFLFDLLTRVGQSAEAARIYSTRLAAQLAIELQLDRFDLDQDLLRLKSRLFVNRAQVFRDIEEFKNSDSGYFVIRAQGGLGKTAVAAKYILENNDCIYHFLTRELGPQYLKPAGYSVGSPRNTIEECLRMLSQQLEARMGLMISASGDLRILENRFNKLLRAWTEERPDERLVIVIDGLDEAEHLEQFFNYFPERPLKHIYFILTTRPLVNIPDQFGANGTELGDLSQEDARDMVAQANETLAQDERFVQNLYDVTGGHPLYLYHLVDEVFNRPEEARQFLDKIPESAIKNIAEYYRWQLDRLISVTRVDERRVGQDTLDLLRILSLLKEAITKEQLQEIAGIGSNDFARAFSNAVRYMMSSSALGKNIYGLFHPKFQEAVQENFSQLPKSERKVCLQKIITYCSRWHERHLEKETNSNDYTFRHYAEHICELAKETKDFGPLFHLLQDKVYLKAKIDRFGRYSALLADIRLAIDAAAAGKIWVEALRFCLMEGYVREAAKQKWQTGTILLDAVEGNLDFAVDEARVISDRDPRGLQLLLISEWLLLQPDDRSREKGKKLVQETIELWSKEPPFVTHKIEEGIMDFVSNILFKEDSAAAERFVSIVNVPGDAEELSLLLTLAKLDREGFFEVPAARSLTGDEFDHLVLSAKQICNTLIRRRKYSHGQQRDAPIAECGTKDDVLAQALFELSTGQPSNEIEMDDLHALSEQFRTSGLREEGAVRGALKIIWRSWQLHNQEKYRKRLPDTQDFIAETPQEGFLPIYSHLRSYLPILTQGFASEVNQVLRTTIDSAPPFFDLLRFYMAKETASMDFHLSQEIAAQIERPLLRGMAYSYVADLQGVTSELRKDLIRKVFEDLNTEDRNSRELLYFDQPEEFIHSLCVLARSGDSLSWTEVISQHFSDDDALLLATKVWFRSGAESVGLAEPEWLRVRLPYQIKYFSRDKDVLNAAGYLAEAAPVNRSGLEELNMFLKNVASYCEREYGSVESPTSREFLGKLFAHEAYILFLLNLTPTLDAEDLDQLTHHVRNIPAVLKKLKVLSCIAVRWQQLDSEKGIALLNEIISEYEPALIDAKLSSYDLRRDVLPTLGFMYQVSAEKSLAAFQQLTELLKLESVPKGAPNWFVAEWSYALAAIANNLERADIRDRYLKLGTTFATGAKDWPYESTLNTIGRDLEGINNPSVMEALFLLLRSAEQFQRTTENYQDALAHAAAHFAKAMVNISDQPLREARTIDEVLQEMCF